MTKFKIQVPKFFRKNLSLKTKQTERNKNKRQKIREVWIPKHNL